MATPIRVVCLCGSTKFKAQFLTALREETLAGRIVLMPGVYSQADGTQLTAEQVEQLTRLHCWKLAISDEVLVINPGGYIGPATRDEIRYARQIGKPVRYLVEPSEDEMPEVAR